MKEYSLAYALGSWRKSEAARLVSPDFERYLSLTLRLYVLPDLVSDPQVLKSQQFISYCTTVPVNLLEKALEVFDQRTGIAIEQKQLSEGTRNNYRSVLVRFMKWLQQQVWWNEMIPQRVSNKDVAPFRVKVAPKLTKGKLATYGLTLNQLPISVIEEIEAFKQFRLTGGRCVRRSWRERKQTGERRTRKPRMVAVKPSTCKREEQAILRFLGWYTKEYPNQELHLQLLTDIHLLDHYVYWATETRKVSHATGVHMARVAVAIAKWLNYDKSTSRNWLDIPVVLELQDLEGEYSEIYEQEKHQYESEKWVQKKLTHEQARQVVQFLQKLCAPNYGKHDKTTGEFLSHGTRPTSSVVRAWQTYLLIKILVYCPIRQEEIRNWKLGETLFRKVDQQGVPYYIVKLKEHKLSSVTRQPRRYRLPSVLTEDLDLWVYKWRPLIVESVKTIEAWTEFWGYGDGKVERIRERLESAHQGVVSERVATSVEQYIEQQTARLQGAKNRIAAWSVAKANLESHNFLFFLLAKRGPESFGKPHYVASVWRLVNRAIARGTKTLFGEERWTNPQSLRHIAEAHIRQGGRSHIAAAFGTLIGHSKKMGDEYAEQVISEYDLTENIVDDWWV